MRQRFPLVVAAARTMRRLRRGIRVAGWRAGAAPSRVAAIVALLATTAWGAANLDLSKSNVNRLTHGMVVTASTNLSGNASQIVYSAPANTEFLLTQVCVGSASGGVLLQIGGNSVAQVGSGQCQIFSPGLLLPPQELLTCTSFDPEATSFCTIMGFQALPYAPTPTPRV